jgi:hypothetical protein
MAQHIPIEAFKQKRFKTIKHGIISNFSRAYGMRTSMRYNYLGITTQEFDGVEGLEKYHADYKIPKSVIFGDNTGYFEIHYDPKIKKVINIFLVA